MGVDAELYLHPDIRLTTDELDELVGVLTAAAAGTAGACTISARDWGRDMVRVSPGPRHFSPGYQRGWWPTIRAVGEALAARYGVDRVRYGTDHDYDPTWDTLRLWDEHRAECDAIWPAAHAVGAQNWAATCHSLWRNGLDHGHQYGFLNLQQDAADAYQSARIAYLEYQTFRRTGAHPHLPHPITDEGTSHVS